MSALAQNQATLPAVARAPRAKRPGSGGELQARLDRTLGEAGTAWPLETTPCTGDIIPLNETDDDTVDALCQGVRLDHARLQAGSRAMGLVAVQIGKRLLRIKKIQGHGAWTDWLEANLLDVICHRSVNNYMRIATDYGDRDSAELAEMTLSALLGPPKTKVPAPKASGAVASNAARSASPSQESEQASSIPDEEPTPVAAPVAINSPPEPRLADAVATKEDDEEPEAGQLVAASPEEDLACIVRRIPLRARIARPDAFDREAGAYLALHGVLLGLVQQLGDLTQDSLASINDRTAVSRSFRRRLVWAAAVEHPDKWVACFRCHGTCNIAGAHCGWCSGQGFEVSQPADGRFPLALLG